MTGWRMIIDAHTHIFSPDMIAARANLLSRDRWFGWLYANPRSAMADVDALIASMDEAGVHCAVTFGFAWADEGLCRESNAYVLDAARAYPRRLIPLAVVNPQAGRSALADAQRALEDGFAGIGELMPDGQGFALDDRVVLDDLMALTRHYGVPVITHADELIGHDYPGKGTQGPHRTYRMALNYPDNRLILAHWGGGLPFYELMPEVREALRNVYYDTAASFYLYEPDVFRHVMAWAPEKVLLGTDFPLMSHRRFLRRLQKVDMEQEMRRRLMGDNARVLFNLPDPDTGERGA
jgi:predicted TIM-barrel fold metal-dependent hydrolase